MKRIIVSFLTVVFLTAITGCMSLVMVGPPVKPPATSDSAMLVADVSLDTNNKISAIENSAYSAWIPWIEDSSGQLVEFSIFDQDSRLDTFYYAENLNSGIYTVKGFIHVYADTTKLKKFAVPSYEPYAGHDFQRKQYIELPNSYQILLEPGHIASLGRFYITYVRTDKKQWSADLKKTSIKHFASNKRIFDIIPTWFSPNWVLWNKSGSIQLAEQYVKHESVEKHTPTEIAKPIISNAPETKETHAIVSVDAGGWQTFFVTEDHTALAAGHNERGKLGTGDTTSRPKPVAVMQNVRSAATTQSFSFIIKMDGTLWGAGNNYNGTLGDRTHEDRLEFIPITDHVTVVSPGYRHTAVLKEDGTLWTTGDNRSGQLGTPSTESKHTLTAIASQVQAVSAGGFHTMYITKDGTLWACGENTKGQLGDGSWTSRNVPVKIMEGVESVAAGEYHTLILKNDHTVWATGYNEYGQLGDGTTIPKNKPVQVADRASFITTGEHVSFFVGLDGSLWSAGLNNQGQLGDGTNENSTTFVTVLDNVKVIDAGIEHAIAVTKDGRLWGWGSNAFGQFGDGSFNTKTNKPTEIKIIY